MHFLTFAVAFQFFDSTAAPIQGVLRGYKDVKATFYSALAAYWGIALPFGLLLDHVWGKGAGQLLDRVDHRDLLFGGLPEPAAAAHRKRPESPGI